MGNNNGKKKSKRILVISLLISIAMLIGLFSGVLYGYRRGYRHAEKNTNKWWIDQQSQYYDAAEVAKKRRVLELDII